MKKYEIRFRQTLLSTAIALSLAGSVQADVSPEPGAAVQYKSYKYVFTMNNVQRGFDGSTYGNDGTIKRINTFCDAPLSNVDCPPDTPPLVDKDGTVLYPIDSEFGFHVVDYLGAIPKKMFDGEYKEGYAGDIIREGKKVGIRISNSSTDKYKVPAGLGTWCAGLGGTSVKCSSEHYTVMEHVLSCNETIPYQNANPVSGVQAIQEFPDGSDSFNCADAQLNDVVNIITNGVEGTRLTDVTPGVQMDANDNTTIRNDIAASSDYSITLKDDGKPLYRWGTMIKRPNDVRLYAKIPLPPEWKVPGAPEYLVQSAKLVVKHVVTNNPNDQIRPEDLENEAAIGRLPSYKVTGTGASEVWTSLKDCYEGDGDLIEVDESDPTAILAGTVLRNMPFAVDGTDSDEPLPFSADLTGGFTNGWYTTVDREPFEWSYRKLGTPANEFEFVSSPVPDASLGELWSGPRWRLKPNKFGQDIPGLEIPLVECSPPPYQNDNIKYEVGSAVTTVINLLDWDEAAEGAPSPLATSKGWIDITQNGFVEVAKTVNGIPVSTNGLPMTEDFDLAIYVKGDKKPTSVYSAQLYINQEPTAADLEPYVDPLAVGGGGHGSDTAVPDISIINGQ